MMRTKDRKRTLQMIADNSIVVKYIAKTVSVESFIDRRNMEKPQPPLY